LSDHSTPVVKIFGEVGDSQEEALEESSGYLVPGGNSKEKRLIFLFRCKNSKLFE